MNPTNRRAHKTKFEKQLTKPQLDELQNWLLVEEVSYHTAIARLKERFEFKANLSDLTRFWNRYCVPELVKQQAQQDPPSDVLLDVIIRRKSANLLHIQILQRGKGVTLHASKGLKCITPPPTE